MLYRSMQEDVTDGADDDGEPVTPEAPRLRRPDRSQMLLEPVCLDERLPADHPARTVWKVVERLDLSQFYEPLKARVTANRRSMNCCTATRNSIKPS